MTKRDAYLKKLEAQLDEWRAEAEKLKAKGREAGADLSLKYHEQADALGKKVEAARAHARKIREAGDDAWESLVAGAESAWSELKKASAEVFSRSR